MDPSDVYIIPNWYTIRIMFQCVTRIYGSYSTWYPIDGTRGHAKDVEEQERAAAIAHYSILFYSTSL